MREFYHLYTRAWVLQEAYLAPRTLDCGKDQLFWRCSTMKTSEEFPGRFPSSEEPWCSHPASRIFDKPGTGSLRSVAESTTKWEETRLWGYGSPVEYWGNIVEIYSRMSLTFEIDRHIAIAGIIDTFRPFLGEYWPRAGMWPKLMPDQLLWRTNQTLDSVSPCSRLVKRRAPSWSWMSLNNGVFCHCPW